MEDNSGIPPFLARLKIGLVALYFWAKIEERKVILTLYTGYCAYILLAIKTAITLQQLLLVRNR